METHCGDKILLVLTQQLWRPMMYLATNMLLLGGQLTWTGISISVAFFNVCMTVGWLIKLLNLFCLENGGNYTYHSGFFLLLLLLTSVLYFLSKLVFQVSIWKIDVYLISSSCWNQNRHFH